MKTVTAPSRPPTWRRNAATSRVMSTKPAPAVRTVSTEDAAVSTATAVGALRAIEGVAGMVNLWRTERNGRAGVACRTGRTPCRHKVQETFLPSRARTRPASSRRRSSRTRTRPSRLTASAFTATAANSDWTRPIPARRADWRAHPPSVTVEVLVGSLNLGAMNFVASLVAHGDGEVLAAQFRPDLEDVMRQFVGDALG